MKGLRSFAVQNAAAEYRLETWLRSFAVRIQFSFMKTSKYRRQPSFGSRSEPLFSIM